MKSKFSIMVLSILTILLALTSCKYQNKRQDSQSITYEVVSVTQYISTKTNQFGGVTDQSLAYAFTYLDDNGDLYTVDEFENLAYGTTNVKIGKTNKYVIQDDCRILYLTKDTMKNISNSNEKLYKIEE